MKELWNHIVSGKKTPDPDKLLDYLEGRLSDAEKHEVESMLTDSAFASDAMDGLQQMKDKQKIASILQELNTQLRKTTKNRNRRFQRKPEGFPGWLLFTTITIILLIVLGYIILKMYTSANG